MKVGSELGLWTRRSSRCDKDKRNEKRYDSIILDMVVTAAFCRGSVLRPVVMNLGKVII